MTRADRTPITNPLPMIGRRATGTLRRREGGRKAIIVPASEGSPIIRTFSNDKSFFDLKTMFLPTAN